MKKTKSIQIAASILLLSWLLISCGGDKTPTEEDVFGSDPTLPATPPTQHSAATTTQPQPNTVIADTGGDGTVTTSTIDKNQMTESGFTVGEEEKITWLVTILEKRVRGYRDITRNLQDPNKCKMFTSRSYTEPLNHLNYWGRFRFDKTLKDKAKEELAEYYRWRVYNEKGSRKFKLLEEAWQRARPEEVKLLE